ncbi:MAG TPA: ABC transporter permease [Vicinamibacterales bacterium]|nr:ABC transporter permease [Vicinamibacterales bacterium]
MHESSRRAYRLLLRLLPAGFRDRAGAELEEAAAACVARERSRLGVLGVAVGWARLIADVVGASIAIRRERRPAYLPASVDPDRLVATQGAIEGLMDNLVKDLRYAIRALRRQPGFTLVVILTLALGIGANTAVFSVLDAVVLRPLPYPHPEQLQLITSQFPNIGFDQFWVSVPEYAEYRDNNRSFESVGGYRANEVNLGTDPPTRVMSGLVTPELMPALGTPPLAGRWFTADDSVPHAEDVAILSWELWQRSFAGNQSALGQTIKVNGVSTRVVGIMPRGYDVHDEKIELWLPLTIDPATFPRNRGSHFLYLVGRLKSGVTIEQARADLEVQLKQWAIRVPNTHVPNQTTHRFRIDPLKEDMVGSVRRALLILQGAVAFVLIIACANLANLLIARADSRMREYALRSALGASRTRLLRQLLTEGLVLSLAGAAAGWALAWGGLKLLLSVNPTAIPRSSEVSLDWGVMAFTLGVAGATALIFGVVPLLHLGHDRVGRALKDSGSRSSTGSVRAGLRSVLVVGEVAIAVLLVVGAGLLIRSFLNLMRVDVGFNRSQLTTFGVVLPNASYDPAHQAAFFDQLTDKIREVPGVQSVSAMSGLPPLRDVNANDTDFEHIPNNRPPGTLPIENVDFWQAVTVGYAETMGIPVVKGRSFEARDNGGPPVVLVNEALVQKFLADVDPIGQRLQINGPKSPYFTIVGVLKDVKQGGVDARAGTELYLLNDQLPSNVQYAYNQMNVVVRSTLPLERLAPQYRRAVSELDPTLPLIKLRSMEDVIDASVARPRFMTLLLGIFAGLALVLAAIGTYGILSYLVAERHQEIGIRMALGADRGEILWSVLARGLSLSAVGLAIGLALSIALSRVLRTLLFDVAPNDPATIVLVAGIIATVAAMACLVPAWRAARVDPIVVLRGD